MFCLIRHYIKNNHNVGCPEKGFYRTFGSGIIVQKDNCQKCTRRLLKRPKMGENGGKLHPFPQEKNWWRMSFHRTLGRIFVLLQYFSVSEFLFHLVFRYHNFYTFKMKQEKLNHIGFITQRLYITNSPFHKTF